MSVQLDIKFNMRREIPYLHVQAAVHHSVYYINKQMIRVLDDFLKISKDSPKAVQWPDSRFSK